LNTAALTLARIVAVVFLVSLASFLLLDLLPGDVAITIGGPDATPDQYQEIREELGLDRPPLERYVAWIGDIANGNFGRAMLPPRAEVSDMLAQRLPVTAQITFGGLIIGLMIAIPVAVAAANRPGSMLDRLTTAVALGVIATPGFLLALVLIFLFVFRHDTARWIVLLGGVGLVVGVCGTALRQLDDHPPGPDRVRFAARWITVGVAGLAGVLALYVVMPRFPRQGFERITGDGGLDANVRSVFLPALTIGLTEAAVWTHVLRADLIRTLQQDYIVRATARGLPRSRVLFRHALRPSTFSLIALVGTSLGRAIGGSIIVERIFNLPGMGTMMVDAIVGKDTQVVQAGVLVIAVFCVLFNTVIDHSYRYLDPRIRHGEI
jgi:peptide/nickel transport system permease protein